MSLKSFLFALDATRIEEGLEFSRGNADPPLPTPADNKARNAQSMAMLEGMMAGVQKGRRR